MTRHLCPLRTPKRVFSNLIVVLFLLIGTSAIAQQRVLQVSGKVTDALDKPLHGATVQITGTKIATSTNQEGQYTINVDPADSLDFTYAGHKLERLPVKNRVDLSVKLSPISGSMNEVIVVGYGQQKKASLVGAQSTVTPEDLKLPARDIAGMLAGRIAGIITTSRGGGPGQDNASVLVRGVSTFGSSTRTPLIIIDGVPDRSFNDIDPEDIQTFTVLKDATSTAVYGTRGANGVILINTKRGVAGKPAINVELNQGISQFVQVPELLDAPTWMELYNESLVTRGRAPFYSEERIGWHRDGVDPDLYPNVKWHNELFRDYGLTQRANMNISGGSEKSTYYISAGYYGETGMLKSIPNDSYDTKTFYRRYNFTANIGVQVTGTTKLDLGIATIVDKRNGPYDGSNNVNNGMFEQSLRVPSHIIPARYSNGEWPATPDGRSSPARIAHDIGGGNKYSATLRPNIKLKQELGYLLKGLSISGLFSFDVYTDALVATQRSSRTFYAEGRDAAGNLITRQINTSTDVLSFASARTTNRRMYSEASLNYQQTFGDHEVGGLLLFNQSEYIDGGATTFTTAIPFRNRGLTGRATYGYNNRYFAEANFGYTGSENFRPDNRFGFFPSFGVGWIMSNEKFFEPLTGILPFFKLRYSYGLTGNGAVASNSTRFLYLDVLTKTSSGVYQFGTPSSLSTSYGGYTQSQFATDPSWETSYRHNLGIEMNFLHNDLKIVAELFRERREGILRDDQTIPASSGFGSEWPIRNIGIVLNKGVDFTLTYNKAFSKSKWLNISGTLTYNTNTNLQEGLPPQPYPWMEWKGKEVDAKTLYTALGLFESQEEIDKWAKQTGDVKPGDIKYADLNGDGVINNFDVSRVNVSGTPKMMAGLNISFGYKGFDIGAFIQGTGRVWLLYGAGDGTFPFGNGANSPNLYAIVKDRWTEENPNPNAFYPRLSSNQDPSSNFVQSTWWLHRSDFIRLKSAEFGYTLPAGLLKRYRIKNFRMFLNGTNLYTLSKWKYWDPELNDVGNSSAGITRGGFYPNIKAYNFGFRVTF
jgi:TonB-linked SusC/RagA family outer membrane protein